MQDTLTPPSEAAVARPARPERRISVSVVAWPVFGVVLTIALWWAVVEIFDVQPIILPSPLDVADSFSTYPDLLLATTWDTVRVTLIGFGLSIVIGVALGTAIAAWKPFERAFGPLLVALNAVPKVAIAPLMIAWFGFGTKPVLAMAFLLCFFPIVLSTATGLTSTPAELAELARSLDAGRVQTFLRVRVPAALPQIFVGLKLAMPLAVIGVAVGEMQSGAVDEGLGTIIVQTAGQGDTATAFAALTLMAVVSIILYYAIVVVERLALPWVRGTTA
ncbi:ABC transporter permease [Paractinoplanes brasiliensis]|uniref:NitT/TauT family transport system permease protein n=1 Tax=Paractinoplanes brasiliensis TaxID=52695 RepID=A0A4V3C8B0_9ACTN|nr:ABC transporter permease [Actinoplanes brasiliensis]TDO40968.1 NitT/TauT family transport system permease protein [Actinoplanes brasiliensis]GID26036.1 ABC transporter permease [Actinoplanes brasiliensis]